MSIERASRDLGRARSEAQRLKALLIDAENRVTKLEHYIEMARAYEAPEVSADNHKPKSSKPTATEQVIEILRAAKKPMHTKTLVDELARMGTEIRGDNPVGNLSSTLSRSKDLEASRSDGWRLVEWRSSELPEVSQDALSDLEAALEEAAAVRRRSTPEPVRAPLHSEADDDLPF